MCDDVFFLLLGIYTGVEPPLAAVVLTKPPRMCPGTLHLHAGEGGAPGEPLVDRPVQGERRWAPALAQLFHLA